MGKKKGEIKNAATKAFVWKVVNFILILLSCLLLTEIVHIVSVAAVAANASVEEGYALTLDIIKDTNALMTRVIAGYGVAFIFIHAINYVLYLLKQRQALIVIIILELVVSLGTAPFVADYIISLLPMFSGLIYLRILRLERE